MLHGPTTKQGAKTISRVQSLYMWHVSHCHHLASVVHTGRREEGVCSGSFATCTQSMVSPLSEVLVAWAFILHPQRLLSSWSTEAERTLGGSQPCEQRSRPDERDRAAVTVVPVSRAGGAVAVEASRLFLAEYGPQSWP